MRSEERSGIISIALILLWGTLFTEPFRYIANNIIKLVKHCLGLISGDVNPVIVSVSCIFVLAVMGAVLLKLTQYAVADYFAPFFSCAGLCVFLLDCIDKKNVDIKMAIILILMVVIALVMLLMRKKSSVFLLWYGDLYIFSLPIMAIMSLYLKKQPYFLGGAFENLLHIPRLVWAIFLTIIIVVPTIYYTLDRRRD